MKYVTLLSLTLFWILFVVLHESLYCLCLFYLAVITWCFLINPKHSQLVWTSRPISASWCFIWTRFVSPYFNQMKSNAFYRLLHEKCYCFIWHKDKIKKTLNTKTSVKVEVSHLDAGKRLKEMNSTSNFVLHILFETTNIFIIEFMGEKGTVVVFWSEKNLNI